MKDFEIISNEDLARYNQLGFIPGPNENESDFLIRVYKFLPTNESGFCSLPASTLDLANKTFFIEPRWLEVSFSNQGLALWEGGFVEISYDENEKVKQLRLQLRKVFEDSSEWLGIYTRDELLAHELAHVGRMAFDEPQFEEHMAYWTSMVSFRRWLGPLLDSSKELWIFIIALLPVFIFPEVLFLPLSIAAAGVMRLCYRHLILARALRMAGTIVGNNEPMARALIYRLTDGEIRHFARSSLEEIRKFMQAQKESSLRWRAINLLLTQ